MGANPTRQLSLQPVAIGAVAQGQAIEAFGVRGHSGDSASVQAVMRMNVEQASKANDAEADPAARRGRLRFSGEVSDMGTQEFRRGNDDGMHT